MKRLISISETCLALSVGRTTVYELIRQGKIEALHIGRRHLVKADSISRLLGECE